MKSKNNNKKYKKNINKIKSNKQQPYVLCVFFKLFNQQQNKNWGHVRKS